MNMSDDEFSYILDFIDTYGGFKVF
jgi:hypothetical protein